MLDRLRSRSIHRGWAVAVLLFALIAAIHLLAAWLKSLAVFSLGLALYALIPLILTRREQWREIGLRRPVRLDSVPVGLLGGALFVGLSYVLLSWWVGLGSANFMVLMAKQQMSYGVVTATNAWQYFPVAAFGFCTISPLTEELFFRGLLLRAFERSLPALLANVFQALFFGLVHLAYFGLMDFSLALIYTMVPLIAIAGVLYGWIAQRAESVWASAIVHAFVNFLLILVVYAILIPQIG